MKKILFLVIFTYSIFTIGCSTTNEASVTLPEGYSPTLYTDLGVRGLTDAGKNVAVEFFTKSQFADIPFSNIKSVYKEHDIFSVVFEDDSALIYAYKDDSIHLGKYDSEKLELEVVE